MKRYPGSSSRTGARDRSRLGRPIASLLLLSAVAAIGLLQLEGCAGRLSAEADNREVRVTRDAAVKHSLLFSPDGKWIAYAAMVGLEKGSRGLYIVPRAGGEPRKLSPDTLGVYPLTWTSDGSRLICSDISSQSLYSIGLDGSVRFLDRTEPLTRVVAVSPDGRRELALRFNRDNRDLGFRAIGGKFEYLAETPDWEEDGSFGPGDSQVTIVSRPSYMAPVSAISVWSPETGHLTPLPVPEGENYEPTWSPDSRYMAYAVARDGHMDVWVYDAGTATAAPLTHGADDAACPAWSPDGDWLAFCRSSYTSHLFAGDPRKTRQRQLTDGPARDFSAVASPDGQWVAFLRKAPSGSGASDSGPTLCVMPIGGGDVRELDLKGLTLPMKGMYIVTWSRDSRELAFNASNGTSKLDIYRIARDGSDLARVTLEPGDEVEPHWSPDGQSIAYTQVGGGKMGVAVVPANGGLPRIVSEKGRMSEDAVWSPGSDRIAYVAYREDASFEVWVTSASDPDKRRLLLTSKEIAWPIYWSRDGRELLLARGKGTDWRITALPVEGGTETEIGREVLLPSGRASIIDLNAKGEPYRDLIYPGGVVVADGKASSDIYMIRTRDFETTRVVAQRGE